MIYCHYCGGFVYYDSWEGRVCLMCSRHHDNGNKPEFMPLVKKRLRKKKHMTEEDLRLHKINRLYHLNKMPSPYCRCPRCKALRKEQKVAIEVKT